MWEWALMGLCISCLFPFYEYFGGHSASGNGLLGGIFFKGAYQLHGIGHGAVCGCACASDVGQRERVVLVRHLSRNHRGGICLATTSGGRVRARHHGAGGASFGGCCCCRL